MMPEGTCLPQSVVVKAQDRVDNEQRLFDRASHRLPVATEYTSLRNAPQPFQRERMAFGLDFEPGRGVGRETVDFEPPGGRSTSARRRDASYSLPSRRISARWPPVGRVA
jgi:hypothetical protein